MLPHTREVQAPAGPCDGEAGRGPRPEAPCGASRAGMALGKTVSPPACAGEGLIWQLKRQATLFTWPR